MAKLTCLLRGLAKEGLISRAFFDSTRSVFECCSASMYFGVGMKMVPSTWLKVDGQSQDNFLFETQRDSVNHYTIDPKRDVQEYFFITKVDLDETMINGTVSGIRVHSNESIEALLKSPQDLFKREEVIKRTLALEPWRVLGNAVSSPSVLKEARAVYNVQLDEKKAIFDKRYKKLKGYFDRLAKKSPKKLKFEDIL